MSEQHEDPAVATAAEYLAIPGNETDYAGAIEATKKMIREHGYHGALCDTEIAGQNNE